MASTHARCALAGCHLVVRRYGFDRLAEDPPHPGRVRGCPRSAARSFDTGGASYLTAPILKTSSGARPAMSIVFSRAKSRRISRCRRQPSTSW